MSRGFKINTYAEDKDFEHPTNTEKLSPYLTVALINVISQQVKLLNTPKTFPEKIEWANNKIWDFSEGKIDPNEMKMVQAYLSGWMDLASEDERNAYKQMYKHIHSLISQKENISSIIDKHFPPNEENGAGKFAKSKNQTAVEQARLRNSSQSFMQQLTSLMTNKPRYATVADAVKDMQERTGLNVHLENIKSAKSTNKKAS